MSPEARRRIRSALLRWYRRHRRDLPWRRTADPYRIWVSEVMLQQTQVSTVVPYYERFLERFPDPGSLAAATEEEVLSYWSGLGYYRRARFLRVGAQAVMERHGGRVPRDVAALRDLPGVGRYTAGAIASIAFGLPEPVLDGNVRRVLARLFARTGGASRDGGGDAALWRLASELVRGAEPGDLNQALVELGATVCTPSGPACGACPVAGSCRARREGAPEAYPPPRPRPAPVAVSAAVAVVRRGARVLLERPGKGSPLRGHWDLPAVELGADEAGPARLLGHLSERHGLEVSGGSPCGTFGHGIMGRRLTLLAHRFRLDRGAVVGRPDLRWIELGADAAVAVSGATLKVLKSLGSGPLPRPRVDGRGRAPQARRTGLE